MCLNCFDSNDIPNEDKTTEEWNRSPKKQLKKLKYHYAIVRIKRYNALI